MEDYDKSQISLRQSKASANNLDSQEFQGLDALRPPSLFNTNETSQLKEETNQLESEGNLSEASSENLIKESPPSTIPTIQKKETEESEAEVQEIQMKSFADAPSDLPSDDGNSNPGSNSPSDPSSNPNKNNNSSPLQKQEGPPMSSQSTNSGLPSELVGKMESTIGHDFSNVNIHTNSSKASDVGALAYTQGTDLHFAPGQFNPGTSAGQELIGHELAHVKQQAQGRVKPTTTANNGMAVNDDKGLEKEADILGAKAASSTQPVQKKDNSAQNHQTSTITLQKKAITIQKQDEGQVEEVPDEAVFRSGVTNIVHEDNNYNISGKYREIVNQLAADGEDGSISTSFDDIVTSSSNGTTARVELTVKIVKRMPVWTDLPQVVALANDEDEEHRAYYQNIVNAWNAFYTALDAHEEGHKAIDIAHFNNCHRRLIGKTMGELDAELTAIEDAAVALHEEFHNDHGAQEQISDVQRPYERTADESDDDEDSVQYKIDPSSSGQSKVENSQNPVQQKTNLGSSQNDSSSKQQKLVRPDSSNNTKVVQGFFPLIAAGAAAFGVGFGIGYTAGTAASSRHTDRNQHNQLPVGRLRKESDGSSGQYLYDPGGDNNYLDANDRVWVLMSEGESVYHQPKEVVDGALDYQWQKIKAWWNDEEVGPLPNKKFISRDDQGGSFEAVLQPNDDGTYTTNWLNSGTQQGTYNYSSPESIGGKIGHFVDDVLPHYLNEDYSSTPTNENDSPVQEKRAIPIQRKSLNENQISPQNSSKTIQLDDGDNNANNDLALTFPFGITSARTNASAALRFLQFQNHFTQLKREIDKDEDYFGDTSELEEAETQISGTVRTLASRDDPDANLERGEIIILQAFINGYESTYNDSFSNYRSFIVGRINSSRRSRQFEPITPELAEAKRKAYEDGDDDQLERLQSLTDSIKDYNEKVSNYIGYASRVSSRVRGSSTLQALKSATGSIAEYAEKAGQIVTAMHIVADFATDSSNSELHTSINRVQRGLDAINLGMSFVKGVPVLGALWEHYYYPAATFCLTKIGEIASRRNRDRRLLTWISSNWRSATPPRIDTSMSVAFPGGQAVFSFLWHLFFGNYQYSSAAEEYFMDHESDINAGVNTNMRVTGKWNPFVDNHIAGFQYWADNNKMDLWLMFYGADLPFPGHGSVDQSLGEYNDDVAQRAVEPISQDNTYLGGQDTEQKVDDSIKSKIPNVNIHQNSSKAASLNALAFAQGSDIHFAPGQFKPDTRAGQELIGHELAHVQQQKEGRVKATTSANGTPINDDKGLEKEADNFGISFANSLKNSPPSGNQQQSVQQFKLKTSNKTDKSESTLSTKPFAIQRKQSESNGSNQVADFGKENAGHLRPSKVEESKEKAFKIN